MKNIPICGFGTWELRGEIAINSTICALKSGYNHIDTASLYGNEIEIGKAIKECDISRDTIWITTKVSMRDIKKGKKTIYNSILNSLKYLDTDYLDLVLLHGPVDEKLIESWIALEEIMFGNVDNLKDKVRYIGVSNYDINHLNVILPICRIKPYVNQFEISPYLNRDKLVKYCKENQIIIVAHTSLIKGERINDLKLENISNKINIGKPVILLAWALNHDMVILPRSSNLDHIKENITSINIKLDDNVMNELDNFYKVDTHFIYSRFSKKIDNLTH